MAFIHAASEEAHWPLHQCIIESPLLNLYASLTIGMTCDQCCSSLLQPVTSELFTAGFLSRQRWCVMQGIIPPWERADMGSTMSFDTLVITQITVDYTWVAQCSFHFCYLAKPSKQYGDWTTYPGVSQCLHNVCRNQEVIPTIKPENHGGCLSPIMVTQIHINESFWFQLPCSLLIQ